MKFYLLFLFSFLFIGCSTKIPITNISNNSLITNKNESILITSNNENNLNLLKYQINQDLVSSGVLISSPFSFNLHLINLSNHSNIDKYFTKTEYFVKDKYCEKANSYLKVNEVDYRNRNNRHNYDNYRNNDNLKSNCMIEKIEIKVCYRVDTNSIINIDTLNNKTKLKDNISFSNNSYKDYCSFDENNQIVDDLEKNNINDNLYYLKSQIFNFIKPNISLKYIEIFEEIESIKVNSIDEKLFEKSVNLIDEKDFIQSKNILLNLYNESFNKYGKIPYEIKFNLALVNENLGNYIDALKYYKDITEINVQQHLRRIESLNKYNK